jgi:hypothetical protein
MFCKKYYKKFSRYLKNHSLWGRKIFETTGKFFEKFFHKYCFFKDYPYISRRNWRLQHLERRPLEKGKGRPQPDKRIDLY